MRNKLLAVLLLAFLSGLAAAQTTSVKGKVTDRQGQPMEGAKVTFKSRDDGTKYEIKVNKKGEYFSLGIKPGPYDIVLSKDGQSIFTLSNVPVTFDDTKNNINIDLRKEQGAATPSGGQQQKSEGVSTDDAAQQAPGATNQPSTQAVGNTARDPNEPIVLTEEQQKKLTPEQKKEYEDYQKTLKENTKIKGLNGILAQAQTQAKAGNYDQAATLVQGAAQQDPNRALLWAILGQYQSDSARKMTDRAQRSQRFGEAATSFDKALQLHAAAPDPKQETASWRVGLGSALDGSGKYDDSLKAFAQAADEAGATNPKIAALAHYNSGLVFSKTGKVDEAAAEFDKTVQLDPTMADAYYQKGTALIAKATADKNGKVIPAPGTVEAFQKYLELAPNGKNVESASAQLEFLGQKVQLQTKGKSK
jgi:tetratricopeptide (TPR) repeat protein